jgi:hypothetical protein
MLDGTDDDRLSRAGERVSTKRTRLEAEGWTQRTVIDEPRLSELVETYRDLGFEVQVVPVEDDHLPECSECVQADPCRYGTIYTRPNEGA